MKPLTAVLARQLWEARARALNWPHEGRWDDLVPMLRAPYLAMADAALTEIAGMARAFVGGNVAATVNEEMPTEYAAKVGETWLRDFARWLDPDVPA